jgi:hypothetical protein
MRLAGVHGIAEVFESHITGLFFNVLPSVVPDPLIGAATNPTGELLETARKTGDLTEAAVFDRLTRLQHSADLRRFDVIGDRDMAETAMQVARVADTFVAVRPNGRASRRGWSEPAVRPFVFGPVRSKGDDALRQHRCGPERKPESARVGRNTPLPASGGKGRRARGGRMASDEGGGAVWAPTPCIICAIMASTPSNIAPSARKTRLPKR